MKYKDLPKIKGKFPKDFNIDTFKVELFQWEPLEKLNNSIIEASNCPYVANCKIYLELDKESITKLAKQFWNYDYWKNIIGGDKKPIPKSIKGWAGQNNIYFFLNQTINGFEDDLHMYTKTKISKKELLESKLFIL